MEPTSPTEENLKAEIAEIRDFSFNFESEGDDSEEIFLQEGKDSAKNLSKTSLMLDNWSLRKGKEALEEKLSDGKPNPLESEHESSDFRALYYEPFHEFHGTKKVEDKVRDEYIQSIIDTPEFKSSHEYSCLNPEITRMAYEKLAVQYVLLKEELKKQEESGEEGDKKKRSQAISNAASAASGSIGKESEDLRNTEEMLGTHKGGEHTTQRIDKNYIQNVFNKVKGNEFLKKIVDRAGRLKALANIIQNNKLNYGQDDIVEIIQSNDLIHALPIELALLYDEDLEFDTLRRMVENQLLCTEWTELEHKQKGPIAIIVDESGSMNGDKIINAKALALSMLWIARRQKRWTSLIGYTGDHSGGRHGRRILDIGHRQNGMEAKIIDWCTQQLGGGNNKDMPLDSLPEFWKEIKAPEGKTDVIIITDAVCNFSNEEITNFKNWKNSKNIKTYGLILDNDFGNTGPAFDFQKRVKSIDVNNKDIHKVLEI